MVPLALHPFALQPLLTEYFILLALLLRRRFPTTLLVLSLFLFLLWRRWLLILSKLDYSFNMGVGFVELLERCSVYLIVWDKELKGQLDLAEEPNEVPIDGSMVGAQLVDINLLLHLHVINVNLKHFLELVTQSHRMQQLNLLRVAFSLVFGGIPDLCLQQWLDHGLAMGTNEYVLLFEQPRVQLYLVLGKHFFAGKTCVV